MIVRQLPIRVLGSPSLPKKSGGLVRETRHRLRLVLMGSAFRITSIRQASDSRRPPIHRAPSLGRFDGSQPRFRRGRCSLHDPNSPRGRLRDRSTRAPADEPPDARLRDPQHDGRCRSGLAWSQAAELASCLDPPVLVGPASPPNPIEHRRCCALRASLSLGRLAAHPIYSLQEGFARSIFSPAPADIFEDVP